MKILKNTTNKKRIFQTSYSQIKYKEIIHRNMNDETIAFEKYVKKNSSIQNIRACMYLTYKCLCILNASHKSANVRFSFHPNAFLSRVANGFQARYRPGELRCFGLAELDKMRSTFS